MKQRQPDWTIAKALDHLYKLYPDSRKSAPGALWLAAREARVKITGCRCKWANNDAVEIGERENVRAMAWVDLVFVVRGGDWGAINLDQERDFHQQQVTRLLLPERRSSPFNADSLGWVQRMKLSQVPEGWCRLRISRAEVLSAFPKPLTPAFAENLARFARLVTQPVPKPGKSSKRRRNEKRSEMVLAIKALSGTPEWGHSQDGERCKLIEQHLQKPKGWCTLRTFRRAVGASEG